MQSKDKRIQLTSSLILIVVAIVYVGVLPAIAYSLPDPNQLQGGERFMYTDNASIVPTDGWHLDSSLSSLMLTILEKSGTKLTLTVPYTSVRSIEEVIQGAIDGFKNDTSTDWLIDEPVYFETEAGVPAGFVIAHSLNSVSGAYIISDGNYTVSVLAGASDSSWVANHDDVEQMVNSIQVDWSP